MPIIRFNYAEISPEKIRNKRDIKKFVQGMFEAEEKSLKELNYIFCSDEFLLQINRTYLKHNFYTDIITFDLSNDDRTIGEIYISVDRIMENSKTLSVTFAQEMLRVIFHGALHLIGYGDKKKSEITVMREKEDYYLRLFAAK